MGWDGVLGVDRTGQVGAWWMSDGVDGVAWHPQAMSCT